MIHSVAVLGAGAVGSYVIWGISSLDDVELGVIAEGERAERIKNEGCLINDKVYHPQVWTPKEAKKADLLVVALKYNALLPALPSIKEAVGENTVVMSLMNGVDSEEIIAKEVGDSHLLYSVIKIASHKEGKGFYFAPKSSYASGSSAVKELKDMVKACHRAGIEVVLEMPFEAGISAQKAMECLKFYLLEYHVDGFVVNPYNVPWDELNADPLLKEVKIMKKEEGFQTIMRRFLKGDENMIRDVMWALKHNSSADGVCNSITAQTGFTLWDLVSYDGKHNEENGERNQDGPDYNYSWNCGAEGPSRKKNIIRLRKNQVKNAYMLLLTAQGTPCLLAGDEFYNSQKGNNNAYCQDNPVGWVNWSQWKEDDPLYLYVQQLIRFRKEHACLHQKEELRGIDRTSCGMPDVSYHGENAWQAKAEVASRQLGVMYAAVKGEDELCFLAYNMHWEVHKFALPSAGKGREWLLAADTEQGMLTEAGRMEDQKEIEL